jgi:hypothetical protein
MPVPSQSGGLQEGLEAADFKRGLGPFGGVVTALFDASHGGSAPEAGVASFNVTVSREGQVEVSLGGADRNVSAWQAVAARAATALRKNPPRIPKARRGVRLTLEVIAEGRLPGGTRTSELSAPRLEAALPEVRSVEAAQAKLSELNAVTAANKDASLETPPAISELPGVYVSGRGKVCSYRLGVAPLGQVPSGGPDPRSAGIQPPGPSLTGHCDVSNLVAKPQRVVRVAVRQQEFF